MFWQLINSQVWNDFPEERAITRSLRARIRILTDAQLLANRLSGVGVQWRVARDCLEQGAGATSGT